MGQGRPLVFFHGWGFDRQLWLALAETLKAYHQCILLDLPGFGQSPLMAWPEFKRMLLTTIGKPFACIGWSLGGLYATRLAIEAPEYVSQLINLASSPCFVENEPWPGIPAKTLQAFLKNLLKNPKRSREQFIKQQLSDYQLSPYEPEMLPGLEHGLEMLTTWDLRQPLSNINCQTAYIFGGQDPIIPIETLTCMQAQFPKFHYEVLATAGHGIFLSDPAAFSCMLKELLS